MEFATFKEAAKFIDASNKPLDSGDALVFCENLPHAMPWRGVSQSPNTNKGGWWTRLSIASKTAWERGDVNCCEEGGFVVILSTFPDGCLDRYKPQEVAYHRVDRVGV